MNTAGVFVLLSLSLFCLFSDVVAQRGRQVDCSQYMDSSSHCSREAQPICGTDNETYGNLCAFCKAVGRKRNLAVQHMGKCS
ncbi:serine protease inhibitor Kazal-type 6-like [Sphaerodactylus townsendi]|uniref:serine protease inhibitor Kazal-type 6-like n=1 Tax=Sphaerodactylus townsendi TaxID=933632 RepID=UPI0020269632|nr:serine protease inhibitor Kazal-type 6-like [Sphaerodactylus townsendi]